MASSVDFIDYLLEQLNDLGEVSSKKMFGEYMIYVNLKPVILVCDNLAYVKKWECLEILCTNNDIGFPYHGAKEHYILDIDDKENLIKIIAEVEKVSKIPKKKKKK